MTIHQLSSIPLLASVLSLALGACSSPGSNPDGTGGAVNVGAGGSATGGASHATEATGGERHSDSTGGTLSTGGAAQQSATGGRAANGGRSGAGGSTVDAGGKSSDGPTSGGAVGTGGQISSGGSVNTGGAATTPTGGKSAGGTSAAGVGGSSQATGGSRAAGGSPAAGGSQATGGSSAVTTTTNPGTCTASKATGSNVSGSGPHKVTMETNSDPGIKEGTIYRPSDLGGTEKYPIFVWGEGGCSLNGLSTSAAMGEIASHGYFVVADGTPNNGASRDMDSSNPVNMGKPLLAYVTWAIAENEKPCSAYYHALDTTKIASNGFSCGGLMAEGTAGDPRMTTWGLNSSGLFAANPTFYKTIHTPVLLVLGGSSDMAYENGKRDYDNISALGIPIVYFSKNLGHGGDLFSKNGGDFTKINLAWLNWWLKGDEGATGKGLLVGSGCPYCKDSAWEYKTKNLP